MDRFSSASPSSTVIGCITLKEGLFGYTVHRNRHNRSKGLYFVGVFFSKNITADFFCVDLRNVCWNNM